MVQLFFLNIKPRIVHRFLNSFAGRGSFDGQDFIRMISVNCPFFYAGDFVEEIGHRAHTVATVDIGLKLFGHLIFVFVMVARMAS